jgi:hypothetical protein
LGIDRDPADERVVQTARTAVQQAHARSGHTAAQRRAYRSSRASHSRGLNAS